MGLLETILARLDKLESAAGVTVPVTDAAPALPAAPVTSASPVVTDAASDVNEHGIPWSAEHHASTKTKTQDGHWTAKRGGDKAALAAYNAQFMTETPPAAPAAVTPALPATPATPATPALPATPAKPALPAVSNDNKEAIAAVNELVNTFKVPYPFIMAAIVNTRGAGQWDQLHADDMPAVKEEVKLWLELHWQIDQSLELLDKIDLKTGRVHGLPANAMAVIEAAAGTKQVGEIPFDKMQDTNDSLADYANQWNEWCKATTGAAC